MIARHLQGLWRTEVNVAALARVLVVAVYSILFLWRMILALAPPSVEGLDTSWFVSLPALLEAGKIAGRDVFFTYGPVWQLIGIIGLLIHPSSSAIDALNLITLVFQAATILTFAGTVLLIERLSWRYSLFTLVLATFFGLFRHHTLLRIATSIFIVVLFARVLAASRTSAQLRWRTVAVAILAFGAQLLTFEQGLYVTVTCVGLLVVFALLSRFRTSLSPDGLFEPRRYVETVFVFVGTYSAANIVLSLTFLATSPTYPSLFHYQAMMLEISQLYVNTMGSPWEMQTLPTIVVAVVLTYSILFILFNLPRFSISDAYVFVGLLILSVLSLKTATIRSDLGHILMGMLPLAILFVLLGKNWSYRPGMHLAWAPLLALLIVAWPGPDFHSLPFNLLSTPLRDRVLFFGGGNVEPSDILPENVILASDPKKMMLAFPHENYIPLMLGRELFAPVLQSYSSGSLELQEYYIESLDRQGQNVEIVYSVRHFHPVSGAQTGTRTPLIFEYIYRNFEFKRPQAYSDFAVLERRSTPRRLAVVQQSFVTHNSAEGLPQITLNEPVTCSLIRLDVDFDYPFYWAFGRVEPVQIGVYLDEELINTTAIYPVDSDPFPIYVGLVGGQAFLRHFDDGEAAPGATWDEIRVTPTPSTLFSVQPSAFEIRNVACVGSEPLQSRESGFTAHS